MQHLRSRVVENRRLFAYLGTGIFIASIIASCGANDTGTPASDHTDRDLVATAEDRAIEATAPGKVGEATTSVELDSDGDGYYSTEELKVAVRTAYPAYAWPPTYSISPETAVQGIPAERIGPNGERVPARFVAGYEHTILEQFNECAWMTQWADQFRAGERATANDTLDHLERIVANSRTLSEFDKERFPEWIEQARLGDPSGLMIFVDGGMCDGLPWD